MHAHPNDLSSPASTRSEGLDSADTLISLGLASTEYVRRTVETVIRFLKTSEITQDEQVASYLHDIDFAHPVSVRSLPMSVFVRSDTFDGNWLTDTGLSRDQVRGLPFQSTQSLWTPVSTMVALQARSKMVFSDRAIASLFPRLDPQRTRAMNLRAHAVGVQFLAFDRSRLRMV